MLGAFLKIIVVALTFPLIYLAELSFNTEFYYAALSAAFVVIACLSIWFAVKTRSNLLMVYAMIYIIGAFLFALMMIPSLSFAVDYWFYGDGLNFGLIIHLADSFIMGTGGISVIYRLFVMRRFSSGGDDIFDARLGLHKWAR